MKPKHAAIVAAVAAVLLMVSVVPMTMVAVVMSIAGAAASGADGCNSGIGQISATGPVRNPMTGPYTVTSEFGPRDGGFHPGLDLASASAVPIVAAQGGRVTVAQRNNPTAGNFVVVDHGGALSTRYLHLSTLAVTEGQQVGVGQILGTQGNTGHSTGPHLHFEVLVNGLAQDPRPWLTGHGVTLPGTGQSATAPPPGSTPPPAGAGAVQASTAYSSTGGPQQVGAWQGEQVVNAALIIKAGKALNLDAWTITVGVMAAMGESSLRNPDHGDAVRDDTIGLFQIGPEHGSYAQRMDPSWAAGNFFSRLLAVPGYRDLAPTIAAHRAQRNADPNHYSPFWPQAVQMVSTLTNDPSLLDRLSADGAQANCATSSIPTGATSNCPPVPGGVENGLNANALAGMRCVHATFPKITTMYGFNPAAGGDHAAGNAVDFMLDNYRTPEMRAYGWQLANWAKAHAQELKIDYIIFDMKIWSMARDAEGWRPYLRYGEVVDDDTLAHRDHPHITFSAARTSP